MDYFNEMRLIVIAYHMMLFTVFVPDLETRDYVGYSCATVIILGLIVNMTQLVLGPIKVIKRKLQIRYAQQQNKLALSKKSMFDGKGYNDRR